MCYGFSNYEFISSNIMSPGNFIRMKFRLTVSAFLLVSLPMYVSVSNLFSSEAFHLLVFHPRSSRRVKRIDLDCRQLLCAILIQSLFQTTNLRICRFDLFRIPLCKVQIISFSQDNRDELRHRHMRIALQNWPLKDI